MKTPSFSRIAVSSSLRRLFSALRCAMCVADDTFWLTSGRLRMFFARSAYSSVFFVSSVVCSGRCHDLEQIAWLH